MLKAVNLFRLGVKCGRCQDLKHRLSTSSVFLRRESVISERKLKVLEEEKKRYENTFGNIDDFESKFERIQDDPEDIVEYERYKQAKGKSLLEYKREISDLLTNHQYKEAIRVLEVDMVNDKIPTDIGIYRMLFNYTALKGDLEEAYRLYVRYKSRQGKMTGPMYTSLFNACANSKNSFLALQKAEILRQNLAEDKFHKVNIFNYNSMLKAFGRHGDITTCLKIFDEVIHKRLKAFTPTYSFLLQSCISDKNAGLRHALLVWRKMIQNKRKPDIWFFNLFLRCVRDCSVGDVSLIPDMIKQINQDCGKFFKKKMVVKKVGETITRKIITVPTDGTDFLNSLNTDSSKSEEENKMSGSVKFLTLEKNEHNKSNCETELLESDMSLKESSQPQLSAEERISDSDESELCQNKEEKKEEAEVKLEVETANETKSEVEVEEEETDESQVLESSSFESEKINQNDDLLPDLMAITPSCGSVISFGALAEPHQRIMLFGGVTGFLKTMSKFNVEPNVLTLSLLLSVSPPTVKAEQEIINLAETYKIQLDSSFFSELLKRRIFRGQSDLIEETLREMQKANVQPSLICFGVLAFGCDTYEKGMKLLESLKIYGFRANCEILYGLLHKAGRARDFVYVKAILDHAKANNIELNAKFIAKLKKIVESAQNRREVSGVLETNVDAAD